ncbi:hypothetical protein [Streptomyces sp. 2A115]|uniref:hypothetical protein n=1 Tax=Streptomyces sp. 2A115 TaxID=3457439 RepID=UPI003FD0C6C5
MEGWNFWWGIAAFFLGGLATQLNGWLAYKRQRTERAEDAAEAAKQRRDEFELQHLIETNQKLHDYRELFLNFTTAVRREREAHEQGRPTPDDDLTAANEALEASESALHGHVGFILDDTVRDLVRQAMTAIDLAMADALTADEVNFGTVGSAVNEAFDALSRRVRSLYAGQPGPR